MLLDILPAVTLWVVVRAVTEAAVHCVPALESWAEVGAVLVAGAERLTGHGAGMK